MREEDVKPAIKDEDVKPFVKEEDVVPKTRVHSSTSRSEQVLMRLARQVNTRHAAKKIKLETDDSSKVVAVRSFQLSARSPARLLTLVFAQAGVVKPKKESKPRIDLKEKLVSSRSFGPLFSAANTAVQAGLKIPRKSRAPTNAVRSLPRSENAGAEAFSQNEGISTRRSTRLSERVPEEGKIIEVEEGEIDE